MLFNSLAYAAFLPAAVAGYFVLPQVWRIPWIVALSCYFYSVYRPEYLLILVALIAIDYSAGLLIEGAPRQRARWYLLVSVMATCAVLGVFKYFNFISKSLATAAGWAGATIAAPELDWALPIGLSFHTFQSLAYVIEVYRGRQTAERNPIIYAAYVLFFPQLVAGPIERPGHMLHQFRERHQFDAERVYEGLRRIVWGLFKKAVIADRLALLVNDVYGEPSSYDGFYLSLATVAFAYQVYCDFSGYSDMALGSAQILGYRLSENFDAPFSASSTGELWRRWHISLSSWFRDYVFIPMGGSRGSAWRTAVNYLATFGLSGLWHGANWTFVIWGVLNGLYLIAGKITEPLRRRIWQLVGLSFDHPLRTAIGTTVTFCLFTISLVLFRATSLDQATEIFSSIGYNWHFHRVIDTPRFDMFQCKIVLAALALLEAVQWVLRRPGLAARFEAMPSPVLVFSDVALALATFLFGVYFATGTFIYFQF